MFDAELVFTGLISLRSWSSRSAPALLSAFNRFTSPGFGTCTSWGNKTTIYDFKPHVWFILPVNITKRPYMAKIGDIIFKHRALYIYIHISMCIYIYIHSLFKDSWDPKIPRICGSPSFHQAAAQRQSALLRWPPTPLETPRAPPGLMGKFGRNTLRILRTHAHTLFFPKEIVALVF